MPYTNRGFSCESDLGVRLQQASDGHYWLDCPLTPFQQAFPFNKLLVK